MAGERRAGRPRTSTLIGAAAVTVVAGLVTTLAVIWPGFDARETPLDDGTVWAVQTGAGDGYARVNLELGELDTVRTAENASSLTQTADRLFVFADRDTQFADIDLAAPVDLTATTEDAFTRSPSGTADVATAGDFLAFRTDVGGVYAATMSGGGAPTAIDPYADVEVEVGEERPRFVADAVAVDADGIVYAYSAAEGRVLRGDARTGRIIGEDAVDAAADDVQLTAAGGRWALLDESDGALRVRGREDPIPTGATAGAALQRTTTASGPLYLADGDGLIRVSTDAGTAERIVSGALGTPAAPLTLDGTTYAAWLGDAGGALWTTDVPTLNPLDYGTGSLDDQIDPVFVTNGARIALNERSSGWVWTVPAGALVASSQDWDMEESTDANPDDDTVVDRVIEPKPPVATDDAFGVRAGAVSLLPVLLNDHDPNEDVLSVDVTSITGLDPDFGTVTVSGAEQDLVVQVADGATGTATFRYRVTDGTTADGLYSPEASVTLTVVAADQNSAPVWCAATGCRVDPPRAGVVPGGTVAMDALEGWIDPEGDPIYLADVDNVTRLGSATGQPDGTVTYQHPDAASDERAEVTLSVTIADARGATTRGTMQVDVTPAPELTLISFAAVGVAGTPVPLDVGPYVTGISGTALLAGAVVLDDAAATVTPNAAGLTMSFEAAEPGSYLVQYTVRDGRGERSATVRITMRDPDASALSTPPLTAFVRPSEDATVDVFPAVANPAGLVLLLSDIRPESDPLATLSVDLVGQRMLRVSGTTGDGGPGILGVVRYTVSDGSGSARATTQGELTVILLDTPRSDPPIAVDDTVTVRAGAQIDIPVLGNDSAPAGSIVAVDPSTIVNEGGVGLAFATGRLVRYLAPQRPGTYGIGYTIFRLGFPESTDSARVTVTVVGDESNRPPLPRVLEGRVLSGESVRIPFDTFGVDPDGDAVTLDRILSQPEGGGTATISAEGDAIVYTSPAGFSGQDAFRYQVRDAEGALGESRVRVGVLAALSDPSPVTFSDYLQIQVGDDSTAVVRPTDNDIDPGGTTLTLVSVVPNAPPGSVEYAALAALLGEVAGDQVTLRAGPTAGTFSFVYTVANDAGDTAKGLIVVKAVPAPVPDFPVVTDTTLTVETREAFPGGVDVLTDRVTWNTGDVTTLRLSLWGSHPGIEVDGRRISGAVPEESLLIPFEVTGVAFDGTEVISYGFLRVPGDNDIRLTLRSDAERLDVRENESRELDLADAIAVPSGRSLEVGAGVRTGGGRSEATCTLESGTTIRYSAGAGAPWTDTCIVPVRLDVQDDYTYVIIQIVVEAEDPEPILRSASITVGPGESSEYDLTNMVTWAGPEDWDSLSYSHAYRGDQFRVTRDGSVLTVSARDDARPGREESVTVTLPSHPGAEAAAVTLRVGPAPSQLPKGGSSLESCSQEGGSTSCTFTVIGSAGEVNPLPGTPLALVSVTSPANCAGVSFTKASASTVRAAWAADTPGSADCTASFVVADAQGRQSSGDRNGTIVLDLQGLPADPARVEWIGFTADSVTLRVISDTSSYPAVEGYRISAGGGVVATCDASGVCPAIPAAVGTPVLYQARAFSAVGESRGAVEVTAWAYVAPAAPTGAEVTPTPNGTVGGVATITVTGVDPTAGSLRLSGGAGGDVTEPVRGTTVTFRDYVIGSNAPTTLTATPLTRFELPPIAGGSQSGDTFSFRANGIGAPALSLTVTGSRSDSPGSVTATATVAPNGVGDRILLGFTDGGPCRPAQSIDANGGTAAVTFDGQPLWREVTVTACAVTEFGGRDFGTTEATGSATPTAGIPIPTGSATYAVDRRFDRDGAQYTWNRVDGPSLSTTWPFEVRYRAGGIETTDFPSLFSVGAHPGVITAVSCSDEFGCGDTVEVTAAGPAYTVQATFPTACASDTAPPTPEILADPADYTLDTVAETDADGVVTLTWTLVFTGALAGLDGLEGGRAPQLTCTPPTPAPTP